MGRFFAELSATGFAILTVLVLMNFVFLDLSVTSTWGKIELTSCNTVTNSTIAPAQKLYFQPPSGFCGVANALTVNPKVECTLWSNDAYWKSFDSITASNNYATAAAEKTMPGVYALLCVMCFICSTNLVVCMLQYIRPSLISKKFAQMFTSGIQFLIFVMSIASLSGATTTPLNDPKNWEVFYQFAKNLKCGESTYTAYIGILWATFGLILSFVLSLLATLATFLRCADNSPAVDTSLTDSLTKEPHSDSIPPNMSVNSRLSADSFTSPIV